MFKDEKLLYFWGSLKNPILREGESQKTNIGGFAQNGNLEQFADLRGDLARKRRGGVFEGGADTPLHTIVFQ